WTAGSALNERQFEAVRIGERQHRVAEPGFNRADTHPVLFQTRSPVAETSCRHLEAHLDSKAMPEAWRGQRCPWKKCEVGARVAFRVRIKQMVGAGIVLIDRPFDKAHAEDAGIKIEVFLRRPGNR